MNIGIVVEGPSDGAAYPVLMRRIRNDVNQLQVRECGGKSRLKHGFVGFLKEFQRNPAWQVDSAFVIRDSDCKPAQPIEDQLESLMRESDFDPQFSVQFFAIKCQLETWLLADERAINHVSRRRGKNLDVQRVDFQFDTDNRAKDLFSIQLRMADLPPSPQVYGEIAGVTNLDCVAERCPSFQRFRAKLQAI